jgi:PhoH-like ATPase
LPHGFLRDGTNDSRILAISKNLMSDGRDVVLVTKDLPLRVKASSVGVTAEEYLAELVSNSGWTGIEEINVGHNIIDDLYSGDRADHECAHTLPVHTGIILHSEKGSALARVTADKQLRLVRGDRNAFGLTAGALNNVSHLIFSSMKRSVSSLLVDGQEPESLPLPYVPDSKR